VQKYWKALNIAVSPNSYKSCMHVRPRHNVNWLLWCW